MLSAKAALELKVEPPKNVGQKSIIGLTLKNTFSNAITSARATIFLIDEHGKVTEPVTRWVIGGAKNRPPLAPGHEAPYNFVVSKPFAEMKIVVNRLSLENGGAVNLATDVRVTDSGKK